MSSPAEKAVHLLVFPYPAQGHMLSLIDLSHQLVQANPNIILTVVVTPKNLPFLHPLLSSHPTRVKTLVLEFPRHPSLPLGVENVKDIGNHGNVLIINALAKLHDPILEWFNSQSHDHHPPPVAIISDFFLGWTQHLAQHLRIPRIAFYGVSAFLSSVLDHLWLNLNPPDADADAQLSSSDHVVSFPHLPEAPSLRAEHLPSIFRLYRASDPDWAFVKDSMIANTFSWGYVFNSFEAYESEYLNHLRTQLGHHRLWSVGPLNSAMHGGGGRGDSTSSDSEDPVLMGWLDGCPDESVVYVCFGSQKMLKPSQVEGLASGLEGSECRFIWVLYSDSPAPGHGFVERVGERGKVIQGWVSQKSILSHRAVGGFLSHCGWNSLMEGVMCGAMILGWPMEADQYVNAMHLVDHLGAAVRVCQGSDTVPDSVELGSKIAEAMTEASPQKRRAKELKIQALSAILPGPGGTSSTDFHALLQQLLQLAL